MQVSFAAGDVNINVKPHNETWLLGAVEPTGQTGLLPGLVVQGPSTINFLSLSLVFTDRFLFSFSLFLSFSLSYFFLFFSLSQTVTMSRHTAEAYRLGWTYARTRRHICTRVREAFALSHRRWSVPRRTKRFACNSLDRCA